MTGEEAYWAGLGPEDCEPMASDNPMSNKDKWSTRQRNDLKACPFCGTKAIEQGRIAESDTGTQWRIQCGNPFCEVVCQTRESAALSAAERAWQERS